MIYNLYESIYEYIYEFIYEIQNLHGRNWRRFNVVNFQTFFLYKVNKCFKELCALIEFTGITNRRTDKLGDRFRHQY